MAKLNDTNTQHIQLFRSLLLEALQAGLFLSETADWRPHHTGEILYFADRVFGVERPAVLVLTPEITGAILTESVESDFRSYIIIGGKSAPDVDLGKAQATRIARMANTGENYWAAFVLENSILVTAGSPLSWCRLVGEVVNAQMTTPFVQRRVCHSCNALNDYYSANCVKCAKPLTLTGPLSKPR
jgi:hypothetical protein